VAGDMRLIYPYVPQDSSHQSHALKEALRTIAESGGTTTEPIRVLDLGCGAGRSRKQFLQAGLEIEWHGLDIRDSPEAKGNVAEDAQLQVYDGVHIPFQDAVFDIVYSRQVFEHVRYPRELICEVARILRNEGAFVGSCSALEPFHSRSICNFTPYGFAMLLCDAGFGRIRLRPGVDGLTLIARRLFGLAGIDLGSWMFFRESPVNQLLELATRMMGFDAGRRAATKLLFSGHFVFSAIKVM
jgi:SAM-dependent methyltransferase